MSRAQGLHHLESNTIRKLKPRPTCPIGIDHFVGSMTFDTEVKPSMSSGAEPDVCSYDVKISLAILVLSHKLREQVACSCQDSHCVLMSGQWVSIVGLFGPSNDGSAVQRSVYAKRPLAQPVLDSHSCVR